MTTKQCVWIDCTNRVNFRPVTNQFNGNRVDIQSRRVCRIGWYIDLDIQTKCNIIAGLDTFSRNLIVSPLSIALEDRRCKCFSRDCQDVATSIAFTVAIGLALVVYTVAINILERKVSRCSVWITGSGFLSQRRPDDSLKMILWIGNTKSPLLDRLTVTKDGLLGLLVLLNLRLCRVAPNHATGDHTSMKFNSHFNLLLR